MNWFTEALEILQIKDLQLPSVRYIFWVIMKCNYINFYFSSVPIFFCDIFHQLLNYSFKNSDDKWYYDT